MVHDDLLEKLPESLRLIIQLTDYRTAMLMIDKFGGSEYHLPASSQVHESHALAELIGLNNLRKICQYWSKGETIYIPKPDRYLMALRDKRIEQDLNELGVDSKTQEIIAKKYGLTTRWVREIRRRQVKSNQKPKPVDRQLDMFANI